MTTPAALDIATRIEAVRHRIVAACRRADRDPASVTLVAVSKTFELDAVLEALVLGVTDFGENRAQEFVPRHAPPLPSMPHRDGTSSVTCSATRSARSSP
ncbi:MAG: hypothetical protein U0360_01960 [Dehalococcoidia bacterium]